LRLLAAAAAPEFSRGFQPTVGVIFFPRRVSDDWVMLRRLMSWRIQPSLARRGNIIWPSRGLKPTA